MTSISFVIVTSGSDDHRMVEIIDSIEKLFIPQYEIIIVGGQSTTINKKNTTHIPFVENTPTPWLTRKKNLGVRFSQYEVCVVMHDYHVFESDWYIEFEKFGTDWDICVQQQFVMPKFGSYQGNGWRVGNIPGYPEIPYNFAVPWDITCFIPYAAIQGAYWVIKREKMLDHMLDETLLACQGDDIEWSSRVVPCWMGEKINQSGLKIVANPKCIAILNKEKEVAPCGPNNNEILKSLDWLWNKIRAGYRRPGVYHYEAALNKVILY